MSKWYLRHRSENRNGYLSTLPQNRYLGSFHPKAAAVEADAALLARVDALGGCLSGITDDQDERLNYLLRK